MKYMKGGKNMQFKEFLIKYGYTNKTFSECYGINHRTVQDWSYRGCPEFTLQLLVKYEELLRKYNKLVTNEG